MADRGPGGKFLPKGDAPSNDLTGATQQPDDLSARAKLTADAVAGEGVSMDGAVAQAIMPDFGTPEYAQAIEELRKRRSVFGATAQKLALPERRGYHRHWFNDVPGRIDEAFGNGWAPVVGRDSKPVSRVVGSGRDNKALVAFAMELPLPIWEEDQAARNREAQGRIDSIKGAGAFRAPTGQAKPSDTGKFYSPAEDPIKMGESLVRS